MRGSLAGTCPLGHRGLPVRVGARVTDKVSPLPDTHVARVEEAPRQGPSPRYLLPPTCSLPPKTSPQNSTSSQQSGTETT